jgi:hypothetical protein
MAGPIGAPAIADETHTVNHKPTLKTVHDAFI